METRDLEGASAGTLGELAEQVSRKQQPIGIHAGKRDLCVMVPWKEYDELVLGQRQHQLHIRTSEEGDWVEISVDGKVVYEGHEFAHCFLNELLEPLGFEVTSEEIPGEDFL
jgi:hypothetical protein